MSADAKAWYDDGGRSWKATHDGPCVEGASDHQYGESLSDVLRGVEHCTGTRLRWEIRVYPDGKTGLVGWDV
jgi:hypothetical protein